MNFCGLGCRAQTDVQFRFAVGLADLSGKALNGVFYLGMQRLASSLCDPDTEWVSGI